MNSYNKNTLSFQKQLGFTGLKDENLIQLKKFPHPEGIVIVGVGGSGLPGNILIGLKETLPLKIPVLLWKNFGLPTIDFKNPFFIFISFSGKTAETLSGLKELLGRRKKSAVALITTDGELKKIAKQYKLPAVYFSAGDLTPRQSVGYTYHSVVKLLKVYFPNIKTSELSKKIRPALQVKQGKILAKKIQDRIPLIYTDKSNAHLGYIWKINFNETAKHPAFSNIIPELAHNEISIFEDKKFRFFIFFLEDLKTDLRIAKKTKSIQNLLKSQKIPFQNIKLSGQTPAEKTWNSVILSNLISFNLAQLKKVEPIKTKFIEKLKA